jgi:non-specific protein-tyrosine kinase
MARRWSPILIVGLIVPAILVFLFTSAQAPVYQASATLIPAQLRLAGDPDVTTVAMSRLVGMATNYSYAATSRELLTDIGRDLGLPDNADDMTRRVDAVVNADTAVLTITARGGSAAEAATLTNAIADAIEDQSTTVQNDSELVTDLETVRQRMLETQAEYQRLLALPPPRSLADSAALGDALSLLRELTNVYSTLNDSLNKTPSGLIVVDEADPTFAILVGPRTLYYTLLAAVAGLLVAAGIASLLDYLDDTIKSPEDVDAVADLPTLGTISGQKTKRRQREVPGLATLVAPHSSVAEAYRALRTSVEFASIETPIETLLVTSSQSGEGKTVAAANLAVAFAQSGRRVLLVDADLRKPGVHIAFDALNASGLTTLLLSESVDVQAMIQPTRQVNLSVLTTGPLPPNPAELLGADRMRYIVDRLKEEHDLVIFVGPPLQAVTDSAILSSYLDGTILVIATGRSRRTTVRFGCEILARAHANVLGAVLYSGPRDVSADKRPDSRVPVVAARAGERVNPT